MRKLAVVLVAMVIMCPATVYANTTDQIDCPTSLSVTDEGTMHDHLVFDQECKHFCDCKKCELYHVIAGPEHMGDPDWICPICGIWHEYRNGTAYGVTIGEHVTIGDSSYAFFFSDTGNLACGGTGEPDDVSGEDGQAWNTVRTGSKKWITETFWGVNLTHVPEYMFAHHENMTGSYFCGSNVKILHKRAYFNNPALTYFEIDDSTRTIEQSCFRKSALRDVLFGLNVRSIGNGAFAKTDLEYLKLNDRLRWVGNNAFAKCIWLRTVLWGKGDLYLGGGAFAGDKSLSNCVIDKHIKKYENDTFKGTGVKE